MIQANLVRTWEHQGSTNLMRTRIRIPFVAIVETIDDVVTVPAGSFENCLRIKCFCEAANSKNQRIEVEGYDWYAPGVGWVKTLTKEKSSDPAIGYGETMTYQLSSIQN